MRCLIYYRGKEFEDNELAAAQSAGFICTPSRLDIQSGDLVIPRYSYLPYAKELESDVIKLGARLINTYRQHRYIADMINWYEDLRDYTPETWTDTRDIPSSEQGPFVIKGETNSKKFDWLGSMYAPTKVDIGRIIGVLQDDGLLGQQRHYIRKFEPFVTYKIGLHGLPVTKEFRIFCAYGRTISYGYYWSSFIDELRDDGVPESEFDLMQVPESFICDVVKIVSQQCTAFVVDVAQHQDGGWRVVEINDLTMSGLSENDPKILYLNLMRAIKENIQ